MARLALQTMI